jgi:hypothetical protein
LRNKAYLDSVATQISTGLALYRDSGSTLAQRNPQ